MTDPTQRFSTRVAHYVRYRPGYPPQVADLLINAAALAPDAQLADVGSGTGLLTQLFLARGLRVFGVEPNAAMRAAGEHELAGYPGFTSIAGAAEATTLAAASVDLIVAGQAFHWFQPAPTRAEFTRILKPGGWVALVWNERPADKTPFMAGYEQLLQTYVPEYADVNHRNFKPADLAEFFAPAPMATATFPNHQRFDLAGVQGRLLSSSYAPEPGHPNHAPLLAALGELFAQHAHAGQVHFDYDTQVYYARWAHPPAPAP